MDEPKPFDLNLSYDGNYLHIDYNDGSDVEHVLVGKDPDALRSGIIDAFEHIAGKEDD